VAERKKRGLGRGLGALIPDANSTDRPVDVFFSGSNAEEGKGEAEKEKTSRAARNDPAASMQSSRRRKTKAAASNTSADAPEDKNATGKASGSASTTKKSTTRSTANGTKTGKTTGSRGTAATSGARKSSAATASTKKSSPAKSSASRTTADAKSKDTKTAGSKTTAARATETTPAASQSSGTKSAKSGRSTTTAAQSGAGAESTPARKSPSSASTTDSSTGPATAAETETSSVKTSAPAEEATSSATNVSESKLETASVADAAAASSEAGSAEVNAERGVVEDQAVGGSAASTVTDGGNRTEKTDSSPSDARDQSEDVRETHPGVYTSSAYGDQAETEVPGKAAQADDTTDVVSPSPEASSRGDHDHQTSGLSDKASATDEETGQAQASAKSSEDTGDEGSAASTAEKESDEESIDEVESIPDTEFGEIPVDLIDTNPRQPRTVFDEDLLAELVHSIREIGVLQPVVVRKKPSDRSRFELIMGERRLRAAKDAGLSTIPAIIRYVDDTDLLRDALLENLHRAELNPLEEAAAYGQLLEDFGCTQEELSERIGRSRPQISNTLRLLRLPPLVQRRVAAGVISAGHARAILGLRDPEHMEVLAQRIVAEGLSVRASEEAVVLLNRGDSVNVSRATTKVSPEFLAVAERLGDRLDTKVNISVGKRKGKLSVEFANQEDLDRILGLLGIDDQAEI
jgi:ParB family chromosome partitioning protein